MSTLRGAVVLPLLGKDLRRAAPLWVAFTVALTLGNFVSMMFMPLSLLLLLLLVGWIALDDPLHATLPFWRTLGLTARQVGSTQLAAVMVAANLTLAVMQFVQLVIAGASTPILIGMMLETTMMGLIFVISFLALATASREFSGFVPLALGGIAIAMGLPALVPLWRLAGPVVRFLAEAPAWLNLLALSLPLLLAILALSIAWRTGAPGRVLLVVAATWLVLLPFARVGGRTTNETQVAATLRWSARPLTADDAKLLHGGGPENAVVHVENIPPSFTVLPHVTQGNLQLDDGRRIPVVEPSADGGRSHFGRLLDGDPSDGSIAFVTSILRLDDESERRMLDESGDLHLRIEYRMERWLPADSVAANTGGWLAPDLHVSFDLPPTHEPAVTLVDWDTRGWAPDWQFSSCELHLVDPQTQDRVRLAEEFQSSRNELIGLLMTCWVERESRRYILRERVPDWVDRAVLVVERRIEVGRDTQEVVVQSTSLRDWVR